MTASGFNLFFVISISGIKPIKLGASAALWKQFRKMPAQNVRVLKSGKKGLDSK